MISNHDYRFDIQLERGVDAETELSKILLDDKIEVKRDAYDNGYIVIEYECRGKPSGIATTEAKYYALRMHNGTIHIVPTERIRFFINHPLAESKSGGDDNASRMKRIPIAWLLL